MHGKTKGYFAMFSPFLFFLPWHAPLDPERGMVTLSMDLGFLYGVWHKLPHDIGGFSKLSFSAHPLSTLVLAVADNSRHVVFLRWLGEGRKAGSAF